MHYDTGAHAGTLIPGSTGCVVGDLLEDTVVLGHRLFRTLSSGVHCSTQAQAV